MTTLVGAQAAPADVKAQYRDSSKLAARANLYTRNGYGEPWFAWVAREAALPAASRVLEVGCGPGWMWEAADWPNSLSLTLTDISAGMVDEAVARVRGLERYSSVEGRVADVAALPFADCSFDAVLACHMLYHVPDAGRALDEIARVLKPGGIVLVTSNGRDNLAAMYSLGGEAFGGLTADPAAASFGLEQAETSLGARFAEVVRRDCVGGVRLSAPEDMVAALTSYPPGETADATQVAALHSAIAARITPGGGVLDIPKVTGMVRGVKA